MFPVAFVLLFLLLETVLWFTAWDCSFFSWTFTSCQASGAKPCAFKDTDKGKTQEKEIPPQKKGAQQPCLVWPWELGRALTSTALWLSFYEKAHTLSE